MRATQSLFSKSFLGRSMEELKRRTSIAMSFEAIKGAAGPLPLYDFTTPETINECIVMSDKSIGGFSQSDLDIIPSSSSTPHARFHGSISTRLPPDQPKIQRSGFAGFRTPTQRPTIFGRSVWDIDPWQYLALRVKSDGRSYFLNLQTESVEPSDLHQHRLFAKTPGQWETVLVKFNDFVRTNHGFVVEPQTEMLRQKVTTFGVGLTDRVEGPFELCIERVWATNDATEAEGGAEVEAAKETRDSELRNKKGEKIRWSES